MGATLHCRLNDARRPFRLYKPIESMLPILKGPKGKGILKTLEYVKAISMAGGSGGGGGGSGGLSPSHSHTAVHITRRLCSSAGIPASFIMGGYFVTYS